MCRNHAAPAGRARSSFSPVTGPFVKAGLLARARRWGGLRAVLAPGSSSPLGLARVRTRRLIFDRQALASHRAMAAILGVILKLPPLKQALASRQVKSHYLEALMVRVKA